MRLLTFWDDDGELRLGVSTEYGVVDVEDALLDLYVDDDDADGADVDFEDMVAAGEYMTDGPTLHGSVTRLLASLDADTTDGADWVLDPSEVAFGPAVANAGKLICVGLNYRKHAEETGAPIPPSPILFGKFSNSLAGHGDEVPLPTTATEYDYEVELGVVIGRTARNVSVEDALDYVFGYATANDLSARDLQMRTSQWLLGKTLDGFLPIGPYVVTADEVPDPQNLQLKTWLNGELRQDSTTADMIFSVAEIISYASQYFTLEPFDVIITGTPEGVIMGTAEKKWLVPGDEVIVEVEGLGQLRNVMASG
ncbi:MAG: fumarylacetoacetate hydrolase family protein [Chloroflexota bacterium]|nr:fumarylacetoacetate hydrolase family protein [Chloroflexota bacterium]